MDCVFEEYLGLDVSARTVQEGQGVTVPYNISRRASDTGVGISTSTARLTIRSKCDRREVTDANAYLLALAHMPETSQEDECTCRTEFI